MFATRQKDCWKQGAKTQIRLHLIAFKWFEHDFLKEAFSHALKAGKEDLAAGVFAANVLNLSANTVRWYTGRFFTKLGLKEGDKPYQRRSEWS